MSATIRRSITSSLAAVLVLATAPAGATIGSAAVQRAEPAPPTSYAGGLTVQQTPVRSGAAVTATKSVRPFRMVAVTWPAGTTDVVARIRVEQGGAWTAWQPLDTGDEGTRTTGRAGTDPLWVDHAEGVEVSVTSGGVAVPDAKVITIDPGARSDDAPARLDAASVGGYATMAAGQSPYPMPSIVTRRGWGANEALRRVNGVECTTPDYMDTIRVAVVHHTAGSNSYTASQSAAIIRSVYAYHVNGRGWCDIGYNFLVDRYGRIFEGRYGGMHLPVRGAHAGGAFNTNTFGVSLMGSFDKQVPPAAMMAAAARVIAWKLDANYRSAFSKQPIATKTMNAISGHRDAKATECPGQYVYSRLPALRTLTSRLMGGSIGTPIRDLAQRLGGERVIGPPFWGEHAEGRGRATRFTRRDIYWSPQTGAHTVYGVLRDRLHTLQAGSGPLGFPREEQHASAVPGAIMQRFLSSDGQAAALYYATATGASPVYGVIMGKYAALGSERSRLRLPVGGSFRVTGGVAQNFQGGRVTWQAATGAYTVAYR